MRSALLSAKQYRDFAAQCMRWAAHAKHEEHRRIMLQMADHWIQTSHELERTDTPRRIPSRARPTSVPSAAKQISAGVEAIEQQS
jgi:hypothetical protein